MLTTFFLNKWIKNKPWRRYITRDSKSLDWEISNLFNRASNWNDQGCHSLFCWKNLQCKKWVEDFTCNFMPTTRAFSWDFGLSQNISLIFFCFYRVLNLMNLQKDVYVFEDHLWCTDQSSMGKNAFICFYFLTWYYV